MDLYLLRHGSAADPGAQGGRRDADRPLTSEGEKEIREVARGMQKLEISLDCILTSPLARAHRTAEIVAEVYSFPRKPDIVPALGPEGGPETLRRALESDYSGEENLLLVGHEPSLGALLSYLLLGTTEGSFVIKKGGLARVSLSSFQKSARGSLRWLLTARQLGKLGE